MARRCRVYPNRLGLLDRLHVLGREAQEQNCVQGIIGEAVYLGEMAQYDFVCPGLTLKIVELNPRFLGPAAQGELYAHVEPEDVVVLVE